MVFRVDLVDYPFYRTRFGNYECLAERPFRNLAVHLLLAPCSESPEHLCRRVGQQGERQGILLPESRVRCRTVLAHAIDFISGCPELTEIVPKAACFRRTSRLTIFVIKIKNDLLSFEVLVSNFIAVLILHPERRHPVSCIQHNLSVYCQNDCLQFSDDLPEYVMQTLS